MILRKGTKKQIKFIANRTYFVYTIEKDSYFIIKTYTKKEQVLLMDTFEVLNNLLVKLFNDILDVEEKAIITDEFKDISVTDMHIIEAVGTEEPRTMTAISKTLGVTMGTLTIGMNALVKKGYIIRTRNPKDRRIVFATLTPKGVSAYKHHAAFHKDMIDSVMDSLNEEEAAVLTKSLNKLEDFFGQWK